MRCFIKHQSPLFAIQLTEQIFPGLGLLRQVTLKSETISAHPGGAQGRNRCRGTGNRYDPDSGIVTGSDQAVTGVCNTRRSRIADQSNIFSVLQPLNQHLLPLPFVVIVI